MSEMYYYACHNDFLREKIFCIKIIQLLNIQGSVIINLLTNEH